VEPEARPLYVVGVGASAGGLEALQRLFEKIPVTGEMAFVVVQHLSPDFKSLMDELLSPHTELKICRAVDGMLVEPDHIYLMPPKNEMIVSGGRLLLTERDPSKGLSLPIDAFFRSLAEDVGTRAIAVVLSGTGSDGSRGIRSVHEAGGLVIAQTESSAKFDGMPRSAVDTGIVDLVLPPEEIGDTLVKYLEHDGRLGDPEAPVGGDLMARIFELLKRESGIDFSDYKGSTVGRRIERRLLLSESRDLDEYVARISSDPVELRALYQDLLIGVTRFCRDPDTFQLLARDVLPELVRNPGDEARLWVPATASGEEAYSLAMLLAETLGLEAYWEILASDVSQGALQRARRGLYPLAGIRGLPLHLLNRYCLRGMDEYRGQMLMDRALRQRVRFLLLNLVQTWPDELGRFDVIFLRNVLMYFEATVKERVLSRVCDLLLPGGLLLVGSAESLSALRVGLEKLQPSIYRLR
jgi:two-component system, chemotaxis family, CheB/CheR fusion protein